MNNNSEQSTIRRNAVLTTHTKHSPEEDIAALAHKPTIMVIEDDKSYRKLWRKIIVERVGAFCVDVEDPIEAFQSFIHRLPDLIIVDLLTPRMNGYTAVHRLRQHATTQNIPIIVCTGSTQKEEIRRLMQLGIAEYIVKPLNGTTVVEKIQKILQEYGLPKEGISDN